MHSKHPSRLAALAFASPDAVSPAPHPQPPGFANHSIFFIQIDKNPCLFRYCELSGPNPFPALPPLPGADLAWDEIEEVFHTDGAADVTPRGPIKRVASVTGLRFEKEEHYRTLHQTTWPNVLKQIRLANIRNYSIYLKDIGDKLYLFSYFEYVGNDFDSDMAGIGKDPVTRRWWQQTDPCQLPLPDAAAKNQIWSEMEELFHAE